MKIYIDDSRSTPSGYIRAYTVKDAKYLITTIEKKGLPIDVIDIDSDAGRFGPPDYIDVLKWMESTGRRYPIHIHSYGSYGSYDMQKIIERNKWIEVEV